jgi:hypothetical protein
MAAEAIGLGTLVSHTLVSQHTLRHSFVARLCSCHGNLKPAGSNCCIPARRDRHYLGVVLDHLAHFIRHSFACDSEDGDEAVGSA